MIVIYNVGVVIVCKVGFSCQLINRYFIFKKVSNFVIEFCLGLFQNY